MTLRSAMRMGVPALFVLVMSCSAPLAATTGFRSNRWAGFYPPSLIERTLRETTPDIQTLFHEDFNRSWLLAPERERLAFRTLEFPREDGSHIVNFYCAGTRVIMPVASLRFLRDVALAYAWLNASGFAVDSITEYLSALSSRWPGDMRDLKRLPLDALGVPAAAMEMPGVEVRFQRIYGGMVAFVLGHELGHMFHSHPGYVVPAEVSRRNEAEADAFALALMARVNEPAIGAAFYFIIAAHLEGVPGGAPSTHPTNPERLLRMAGELRRSHRGESEAEGLHEALARHLETIAATLSDPAARSWMVWRGRNVRAAELQPRAATPSTFTSPGAGRASFAPATQNRWQGSYRGEWRDNRGFGLPGVMVLQGGEAQVTGGYTPGTLGDDGQLHLSRTVVTIHGSEIGGALRFRWRMGDDHAGRGVLTADPGGRRLRGTWGFGDAESGAGTWHLER